MDRTIPVKWTDPIQRSALRDATLRDATLADIPALREVERDADRRYAAAGHPELCGEVIADEVAARAINAGRITVAVVASEVAGWIYVGAVDGEPCIGQVSVVIARGRVGIGTALLDSAISKARSNGARSILLNTQRDVPWNAPWYARRGFVEVPESAWSEAMRAITDGQVASGLDWSRRVHMRKALRDGGQAKNAR